MPWPHLSALLHFYLKPAAGAAVWIILLSSPSSFIFSLLANSPDVYFRSPLGTSHSPAGISPLALISICVALFFVLVLISIFSLLELSCKLYMLVWQYGAVKSLSHTLTFTLFSRYSRKLSVCAVSVQRVMMCRTALKMDQCLHCRTDAQSLPPCISSITTQFQIHFPLLWTSCNTFFLLQLCYCNDLSAVSPNPFSSLSLPFQFSHLLTFLPFSEVFLRFHHLKLLPCPSHFHNASHLSWLLTFSADPQKFRLIHPNSNLLYLP